MLQPPPQPSAMPQQTYLQYASHMDESITDLGMSDVMTMIPGISFVNGQQGWLSSPVYGQHEPMPVHHQQAPPPPPQPMAHTFIPPVLMPPPTQIAYEVPGPAYHPPAAATPQAFTTATDNFRRSRFELSAEFARATSHSTALQTSQFKK